MKMDPNGSLKYIAHGVNMHDTTLNNHMHSLDARQKELEASDDISASAFWAGQLSIAAGAVTHSTLYGLSANINWLEHVRLKYDAIILQKMKV